MPCANVPSICPFSPVLPSPNVSITAAGSLTAGQTYSLTCSVSVVEHLVVQPSIVWRDGQGREVAGGSGSDLQLTFDPLRTPNGSHYTCTASVSVLEISLSVSGETSTDVVVSSKSVIHSSHLDCTDCESVLCCLSSTTTHSHHPDQSCWHCLCWD